MRKLQEGRKKKRKIKAAAGNAERRSDTETGGIEKLDAIEALQ